MQWSKLRTRIEGLFAESVRGRCRLHSTRYRKMHDQEGRAWITLDGYEIQNMPHIGHWLVERDIKAAALAGVDDLRDWRGYAHMRKQAADELRSESIFRQGDLGNAMYQYLRLSIEDIHVAADPLVRALGILDRRTGKRSLSQMNVHDEHPLVKVLYRFRCTAEGLEVDHGHCGD